MERAEKPGLNWTPQRFEQTVTSDRWVSDSVCGLFRVAKSHIRYGASSSDPIPDVCYAMELQGTAWNIISKHREMGPAMKACEKRHRQRRKEAKEAAKLALQQKKKRLR